MNSYPSTCSGAADSNYTISYVDGSVVVNPASLTIIASGGSTTYGSAPPTITASYSGFVNGDTAASLTTAPTCSTTATPSSPAGSYASSCEGASDPNYAIGYTNGSVTVNKASLTVTASSGSTVYGTAPPAITPTYSGFVNGDTSSSLTTAPTCSTTDKSSSPVGSYPSSCSGAADPNYTIGYVKGSIAVTPAPLKITASSGSITYGGAVPAIIASYSGFVNGDTYTSLTTQPTCTTTATSSSPPGSFSTSCSGASDPNYTITYVSGTLTVLPVYTSGGSFVIGNLSAGAPTLGKAVQFWGAQWAKANQLSGGSAPSSFKGFEDSPAVTKCGVSWTTDPGNRTPPPSTVPTYTAMIVSGTISQSGSVISGNTVHVVIVKTDPGYGPNPGHAGTGTIVGVVC